MVAPSGPFDRERFELAVGRLRERFDVRYDDGIFSIDGYLAGNDARRLGELRAALRDDEVRAIVAARGGFGATHLLPDLPVAEVRAADKLLVGFSDITALHATWARAGLRSVHGPMVAKLGRASEDELDRWSALLGGVVPAPITGLEVVAGGVARGPLLGGNLAVLCSLVGTPYAPPLDGAVLFVEDVGERPYRVDRMLTQLEHAGFFDRAAGLALGAFSDCMPGKDGVTVEDVLRRRLSSLPIPVLSGVAAGHIEGNLPLPFGAPVELDGEVGELRFGEGATSRAGAPSAGT